jgi:DNA-binding NarL/FixJ family response regulator
MSEIGNPESSGNRRRILLADDHPLMLERVTTLLQPTFDVVGVAHNGLQMVEEAMRLNPDIIVADISMPELDGIEAAHRLREMGATASVVFLTIHESPEFVEACLAEGALGYVVKAHMKRDLVPAINAALSGQCFVSSPRQTNT